MAQQGEKIAALTCYDASFAKLLEAAGVEILLVGDSLGMVVQGQQSTLPVSMRDMVYHTRCVARGNNIAYILTDMPFGSYQGSAEQAVKNAARLLAAGANMVKLEGGAVMAETVRFIVERGIPVCAHIGLTPQSVNQLGYSVQGKTEGEADRLLQDALKLEAAGAAILLMEAVPALLAQRISEKLSIPTIGIGAGPACSAQVLVLYDALGIYPAPSFAKNFMQDAASVQDAIRSYVEAVKSGAFPAQQHSF